MNKTPVTLLQELLTKRLQTPNYTLVQDGTGTHDPVFKYEVSTSEESAIGSGKSKKEAKHEAARLLLEKLSKVVKKEEELDLNIESPYADVLKDNAVGMLDEYCAERNLRKPEYKLVGDEGLPHAKRFSYKCSVSSFTTESESRTKKQAKQLAAQEMLNKLKQCLQNVSLPPSPKQTNFAEANEIVSRKLMERSSKTGSTAEQLGLKLSDYYEIFKSETFPHSELLLSIQDKNKEYFANLDNPEEVCENIFDQLEFNYEVESVDSIDSEKIVFLKVEGHSYSNWTFYGLHEDVNQATRKAYLEALTFMTDMSRK